MLIKQLISDLRKREFLTLKELAAVLSLPESTIKNWQYDKNNPSPANLRRIVEIFPEYAPALHLLAKKHGYIDLLPNRIDLLPNRTDLEVKTRNALISRRVNLESNISFFAEGRPGFEACKPDSKKGT